MDTNETVTVQVETVGQAYLEVLRARDQALLAIPAGLGSRSRHQRHVEENLALW
jgi:hypothetical protein